MPANSISQKKAWVITSPASATGRRTAFELPAGVPPMMVQQ